MQKKYAIVTIVGNGNYGNRLQNYALDYAIRKITNNEEVYTIWYNPWKKNFKDLLKKHLMFLKGKGEAKKYKNFAKFTNTYTTPTKTAYYVNSNLLELKNRFDKIIIGSDQIWNYTFFQERFGYFEFAKFEEPNKCISYSASFGVSSIPQNMKTVYKDGLMNLSQISVRENAGAEIVKELTGREAKVVLDPTMLLTADEWKEVEIKPNTKLPKKYILTYFLGNKTEQQDKEINELSNEYNLGIINLNDKKQLDIYISGPSEFVYLFHHADIVFTDSFHACVFSILFEKPFFVFDRNSKGMVNMNSRLDTLLGRFNLSNQKRNSISGITNVFDINYKYTNQILEFERIECYSFLQEALNELK